MVTRDENRSAISAGALFNATSLLRVRQSLVEQCEQNRKTIEEIDKVLNPNAASIIPIPKQPTFYSFPTQPGRNKILFLVLEAHERLNLRWVTTEHPYAISRSDLAQKLSKVVGWEVTADGIGKAINEGQKELKDKHSNIHDAIKNIKNILKKTYGISD